MSNVVLNGALQDPQYIEMCEAYEAYVTEHINNVKEAYRRLFNNPDKPFTNFHGVTGAHLDRILNSLEMAINVHDSTKYMDEEFEGYRAKFNPTDKEKKAAEADPQYQQMIDANYQTAWFHHYTNNNHHPLYWKWTVAHEVTVPGPDGNPTKKKTRVVLRTPLEIADRMSPVAILHMICDWEAMGIKFNTPTPKWYIEDSKDERRAMNPATIAIVEELLEQLYGVKIPKDLPL